MRRFLPIAIVLALSGSLYAQTVPSGFTVESYGGGLAGGTAMAFTPDGRLLVCQQSGVVQIIKAGIVQSTPFHTAASVDNPLGGERGLLGMVVDPDFSSNGYVYIYVTTAGVSASHNEVRRLTASPPSADVSDGSEPAIVVLEDLGSTTSHNGGGLAIGGDGKLFVAVGDGVDAGKSQSITSRFGKILRYNRDGSIPGDNPASFPGISGTTSGEFQAIWAVGLRNPWRIAFQPGTMHLHINDVGEDTWEEVNEGVAGSNYGWQGGATDGVRNLPNFSDPIFVYNHNFGTPMGPCITGGAFYNPPTVLFPTSYLGKYFFSDFGAGFIYTTDSGVPGTSEQFLLGASGPVDLQVGPDGALYYLSITGTAGVYRVSYGTSTAGGSPSGNTGGSTGTSSGSSSSSNKCGALGLEALMLMSLLRLCRRRV